MIKVLILLSIYTLPYSDALYPPNYVYVTAEPGVSAEVICAESKEYLKEWAVEHEKSTGSRLVSIACIEVEYAPFKTRKPDTKFIPLKPYTPTENFVFKISTYNRYNYSNRRHA